MTNNNPKKKSPQTKDKKKSLLHRIKEATGDLKTTDPGFSDFVKKATGKDIKEIEVIDISFDNLVMR